MENIEPTNEHLIDLDGTLSKEPRRDSSKDRLHNMRCPNCSKLFRVDAREIASSAPEFECSSCKTTFTFDYPPKHPHSIATRFIKKPLPLGNLGALNTPALLRKPTSPPILMKMWHDLLQDYENLTKHVAFVDRCEDLQALPYALKRYENLKEAQPHDEVAQEMLRKVWMKSLERRVDRMAEASKLKALGRWVNGQINWSRVWKMAPVVVGLSFITVGVANNAMRNLVGVGSAMLLLTVGLRSFRSQKFKISDYF